MTKKIKDVDQFIGKIKLVGTSLYVLIPAANRNFAGLKRGDWVKVWFQKISDNQKPKA